MSWKTCIKKLLRKHKILTLEELQQELDGRSRASVFRDLCEVGYRSSYSHNGKYFTLEEIPSFNADGVWRFNKVGFSRYGTLKKTVVELVERSQAGYLHEELRERLGVRAHNTLLLLVSESAIARREIQGHYLYVNKETMRATAQLARREALMHCTQTITGSVPGNKVIEILVEVLRANRVFANVRDITERLVVRGVEIAAAQVEQVLEYFEVKKRPTSK